MNTITELALQRVVERPKHLDKIIRSGRGTKFAKIAETLKLIERTKALSYDKIEYEREFGKHGIASMRNALKKHGIKKPRVILDENKVYVWANDEK